VQFFFIGSQLPVCLEELLGKKYESFPYARSLPLQVHEQFIPPDFPIFLAKYSIEAISKWLTRSARIFKFQIIRIS
jgi:hypothetical protein